MYFDRDRKIVKYKPVQQPDRLGPAYYDDLFHQDLSPVRPPIKTQNKNLKEESLKPTWQQGIQIHFI